MRNIKSHIKKVLFILIINVFLLIFLEGICSTILALKEIIKLSVAQERYHIRYDELLGWSHIPNSYINNLYGPGTYLKINSQGFRNNKNFDVEIPKGKLRIVCCGDSFTLGAGVDNEHPWCEQLTSIDKRLETINMGQGGYGIDQAYLWYMRDRKKFNHNIQIFAFIIEDLRRIKASALLEYSKPVLKITDGALKVANVPVPLHSYWFPNLDQFKLYQALASVLRKIHLARGVHIKASNPEIRKIVLKIFETLEKVNKEKRSKLVLVLLPDYEDCYSINEMYEWREWLKTELVKRDILFIDLYDDFLRLPLAEALSLFIPDDGHYSEKGNKFVARALYKKLHLMGEFLR